MSNLARKTTLGQSRRAVPKAQLWKEFSELVLLIRSAHPTVHSLLRLDAFELFNERFYLACHSGNLNFSSNPHHVAAAS